MKATKRLLAPYLVAVLLGASSCAAAQENDEKPGKWEFSVAPLYLWMVSMSGSQGVGPVNTPINLNFKDDVLENLDAIFTIHFEAKKGKWVPFADYMVATLKPTAETLRGVPLDVELRNDIAELGVAYELGSGETSYQVLGGVRWTNSETDVSFSGGPQLISVKEDWYDGFIGGRVIQPFAKRWRFSGRGDIGAGGSDFVYNVMLLFNYRFKKWGSAFGGYRWLGYDYDNGKGGLDRFVYKIQWQGPALGLNFHF